jgi:hypothetical protein
MTQLLTSPPPKKERYDSIENTFSKIDDISNLITLKNNFKPVLILHGFKQLIIYL